MVGIVSVALSMVGTPANFSKAIPTPSCALTKAPALLTGGASPAGGVPVPLALLVMSPPMAASNSACVISRVQLNCHTSSLSKILSLLVSPPTKPTVLVNTVAGDVHRASLTLGDVKETLPVLSKENV